MIFRCFIPFLLLLHVASLPQIACGRDLLSPRACRSVHLWWQPDAQLLEDIDQPLAATAFYNELTVDESTRGSYFMACGFSKGYFGIQELGNGKKIALFSIWEPGKQNNPNATPEERRVKTIDAGDGVRVKRFGGEGTGGQSFYDYDWKIGASVRFVVFARPDGIDRTQYAAYIYLPNESRWQHMATFSTLASGQLLSGYYSFVEDFLRNGQSAKIVHRAIFGNGWIQIKTKHGSKWLPLTRARFTADKTPTRNIDSGAVGGRVFLQTGGDTENGNTKLRDTTELPEVDRKPPLDLPDPFGDEVAATYGLRVLSYNVKHGRGNDGKVDLKRTARVIRRLNPDVVAFQEIDNKADRSGNVDEARQLAELTGLRHHAFGRFFEFQGGEYGMAVISRFPLSDIENLRLPDGVEPRTSLIVTVGAAQPFRLANVHFYRTEMERLAQAKALLKFLDGKNDIPCIIAGDFNSQPDSPVLQLFSDWNVPDKGGDRFTFSSDKPNREIDFIMYRPDAAFGVREIDVVEEPVASDHRPLSADLSIVSRGQVLDEPRRDDFIIAGHNAFVLEPPKSSRRAGPMPWVWYAPTLRDRYPGREEEWMFKRFHDVGLAVAGIDVGESYGNPQGRALYQSLYEELTINRGYGKTPVLLARSRGGLMLYNWAVEHAESVGGIAGIYPVCNIASYPGVEKAADALEMTAAELRARLAEHNPIDRLAPLAKAKVPIFHIHGDQDRVVPLESNSAALAARYKALGGPAEIKVIEGQGHNLWTGWFQSDALVNFVISCATRDTTSGQIGGDE